MKKILSGVIIGLLFFSSIQSQAENSKCFVAQAFSSPESIDNFVGHYPNKIKLVFTDIDGTIAPFHKNNIKSSIPFSVKQSVKKMKKADIPLILITGRPFAEAKFLAEETGNDNIFISSHQGGEIWTSKGELLFSGTIPDCDLMEMYNKIEKFKHEKKFDSGVYIFSKGKMYSDREEMLPYGWEKPIVIKSISDIGPVLCSNKIVVVEHNREKLLLIKEFLSKNFPQYKVLLSTDCYCSISLNDATKGDAVRKMAGMLGVDLKNVAVFGDAENDLSMFELVKKSGGAAICVENAMPELKKYANYQTRSVYDGGFSYGVKKIIKNNDRFNRAN